MAFSLHNGLRKTDLFRVIFFIGGIKNVSTLPFACHLSYSWIVCSSVCYTELGKGKIHTCIHTEREKEEEACTKQSHQCEPIMDIGIP